MNTSKAKDKMISHCFLDGLLFTHKFYTTGVPSWTWIYKYHFAPPLTVIERFIDTHIPSINDNGQMNLLYNLTIDYNENKQLLPPEIISLRKKDKYLKRLLNTKRVKSLNQRYSFEIPVYERIIESLRFEFSTIVSKYPYLVQPEEPIVIEKQEFSEICVKQDEPMIFQDKNSNNQISSASAMTISNTATNNPELNFSSVPNAISFESTHSSSDTKQIYYQNTATKRRKTTKSKSTKYHQYDQQKRSKQTIYRPKIKRIINNYNTYQPRTRTTTNYDNGYKQQNVHNYSYSNNCSCSSNNYGYTSNNNGYASNYYGCASKNYGYASNYYCCASKNYGYASNYYGYASYNYDYDESFSLCTCLYHIFCILLSMTLIIGFIFLYNDQDLVPAKLISVLLFSVRVFMLHSDEYDDDCCCNFLKSLLTITHIIICFLLFLGSDDFSLYYLGLLILWRFFKSKQLILALIILSFMGDLSLSMTLEFCGSFF
ncbi:hypothetical protein TVAG_021410 [Trichomonas vaginalis G3]|uniref:Xrn1 helical domain-containing protein n=1 Tax=Trichomonas vaginalis (strain ATCC PRA-98 / G3) TaxID=412133 RepID=A2DHC2_TRIV3|nr:5'-3' exoribonuclease protein [Trichomonas vaginalis G3]EAY20195.1 hypothetical protein TVAG_021410 [Trichomonas vaginalis G3]KAI5507678.1 5'-3' exoribonuclease protein [Trichomonas vaginalis G3]|eukprot:XP_001581181.1 hypothetical protein [Trichomonas vaginalis G3]